MLTSAQTGTLLVKVEEVRELERVQYVQLEVDGNEKATSLVHSKSVTDQKWNEELKFAIYQQSDLEVYAMKKKLIGKPKILASARIPIPEHGKVLHDWFPLLTYLSPKKLQKNMKAERYKLGEVRLKIQYTSLKPKKEREIKGLVVEGKWTKQTCGGTLMNHSTWTNNPQFLLEIKSNSESLTIKIFQPDESEAKMSFYVLKYDEAYGGRKKVVFSTEEIMKIESVWAPIFSDETEANLQLTKGKYCIIPCTESPEYEGTFFLNIIHPDSSKDHISLTALPLEQKLKWHSKTVHGEWTSKTAGGGNITGTEWRKNPQFILDLRKEAVICFSINQDEKDHSIGFYVIKDPNIGKKAVEYKNEVTKTESFKFSPSAGIANVKLPSGKYILIACSSQPKASKFYTTVYADTNDFDYFEITKSWEFIVTKGASWKEGFCGGSPNESSFAHNPQFLMKIPNGKRTELVLDLSVPDDYDAIGFLAIIRDKDDDEPIKKADFSKDDILCQPEGWKQQLSVSATTVISEKLASSSSFVIIPSTFKAGVKKAFRLSIFSDNPVEVTRINGDDKSESEEEENDE